MLRTRLCVVALAVLGFACGGGGGGSETANHAPIAAAGPDQNVMLGSRVTLDGSSSSDADGDLLSYRWTFTARPASSAAVLSNTGAAQPTFVADAVGTYAIELVVNDGTVDSASDAMVVTAVSGNAAPVANAGPEQRVITGAVVMLDGSASSDANHDLLTYRWSFTRVPSDSSAMLSSATSARPTFAADRDGVYVVALVVNDGHVDSAVDSVTVTATHTNAAPVANAGPNQQVITGALVLLDGSASSDANEDRLTYQWTVVSRPPTSAATLSNAATVRPTFTADVEGSYVIGLVVNDGEANSEVDTVTVTAATSNATPVANAGPDQNVATHSVVTLDGSASSDADGDTLTYQWAFISKPPGAAVTLSNSDTVAPTFTPDADGSYVVGLDVSDGKVTSAADTVTVTASTANSTPIANAGSDQNVATHSVVTLDGSASSDADGDTLTYQWAFISKPPGAAATLSSPNTVAPTFTADVDGSYVVGLDVSDGKVTSATDTVTVTAATANSAPVANAGPDQNVTAGALVTLDGSACSDADFDPLSYQWTFVSKPSGSTAALSNATALHPTFTADLVGDYVISLVVDDGEATSAQDAVMVSAAMPPDTENADRLFDLAQMHTFDIEVAPADWEWLNANALREEYVPATLIFEGRRIENIGLRFKGSYNTLITCFDENGTRICPKLSIKLKFNEYAKATRFKGLRKLNFNSSVRDATFLHEVITYYLFRALGVPAPRASHALINVNGEPQGLFVMVEEVDDEFIKSHWASATGGNLYKSIWPQYTVPGPYEAALENNTTDPNVSRMQTLTETALTCTDETFPTAVSTQLDLPSIAKYLAVDRAVFADDGVQIFYCADATIPSCVNNNYYWYEVPSGPSELIPWDVDYTLAEVNLDLGRSNWDASAEACTPVPYCEYMNEPGCDPAAHEESILRPQCQRLFGLMHRATWNDYRVALRQLADGPMSHANIVPIMNGLVDKIRPLVAADTHGPGSAIWEDNVDWMYYVLDEQLVEIERLLAEP